MRRDLLRRAAPPRAEWDPSSPLEEQSGWDDHAEFMDRLVEQGVVVLGGPLADEHRVVLAMEARPKQTYGPRPGTTPGAAPTWW